MTEENHVFLVLDGTRTDTFLRTEFDNLPDKEHTLKAHSPAVWTIPSFLCYFLGYSPARAEKFPFDVEKQARWIPSELRRDGYNTKFHTGSAWMKMHQRIFNKGWTDYDVKLQKDRMDEFSEYTDYESPFLEVFHILEPHHPAFDGEEEIDFRKDSFHNFEAQQKALRYVDRKFGEMLENIPEGTVVTLTADHADAWGEEESWGHNPNSSRIEEGYRLKSNPDAVTEVPYARGKVETDDEGNKFVNWRPWEELVLEWYDPREQ